jgi:hypothetical protein
MRATLISRSVVALACTWCLLGVMPALGAPITFSYTGVVTDMNDPTGGSTGVHVGDAFQFTFTFDSDTTTTDFHPDVVDYAALLSASTTFTRSSVEVFTSGAALSSAYLIEIVNDHVVGSVPAVDGFAIRADSEVWVGTDGLVVTSMYVSLITEDVSRFSSADLSVLGTSAPEPGLFEKYQSFIFFQNSYPSGEILQINGIVTGVAEPSTMLLLGLGLVGLAGVIKKMG